MFQRRTMVRANARPEIQEDDIPLFTAEELKIAETQMKTNKAPGPDNIPSERIKTLIKSHPEYWLQILNNMLIKRKFPKAWKETRLVLIEKNKKQDDTDIK